MLKQNRSSKHKKYSISYQMRYRDYQENWKRNKR